MKIEKISDTQIRCTLNREDLISHEIKLSELAYGSEKAKVLFHDMIEQAKEAFGFEAENYPLMIEAIPVSPDCIILIITKVDNPEDIDNKFAGLEPPDDSFVPTEEDDVMDLEHLIEDSLADKSKTDKFIPMSETLEGLKNKKEQVEKIEEPAKRAHVIFSFKNWTEAAAAAEAYTSPTQFDSEFYKRTKDGTYLLCLSTDDEHDTEFVRLCNLLSEYGQRERTNASGFSYLTEHCELIIKERALLILAQY